MRDIIDNLSDINVDFVTFRLHDDDPILNLWLQGYAVIIIAQTCDREILKNQEQEDVYNSPALLTSKP